MDNESGEFVGDEVPAKQLQRLIRGCRRETVS